MVGGIWEVMLVAQLEAGAEPGVQLGTCRGGEERLMPNMQPLLRFYPIKNDTLCLNCTSLPHSSPPQKKDV